MSIEEALAAAAAEIRSRALLSLDNESAPAHRETRQRVHRGFATLREDALRKDAIAKELFEERDDVVVVRSSFCAISDALRTECKTDIVGAAQQDRQESFSGGNQESRHQWLRAKLQEMKRLYNHTTKFVFCVRGIPVSRAAWSTWFAVDPSFLSRAMNAVEDNKVFVDGRTLSRISASPKLDSAIEFINSYVQLYGAENPTDKTMHIAPPDKDILYHDYCKWLQHHPHGENEEKFKAAPSTLEHAFQTHFVDTNRVTVRHREDTKFVKCFIAPPMIFYRFFLPINKMYSLQVCSLQRKTTTTTEQQRRGV